MISPGQEIRHMRKQRGWTQKRLSIESGVNDKTICGFEMGRHGVSLEVYKALLNAMGYTIEIVELNKKVKRSK